MTVHHPELIEVVRRDPRYALEAYEFIFEALEHTQKMLRRRSGKDQHDRHVSGPELLEGVRELALEEFGLMARVVFRLWGIDRTDDVGEIIFNLIDASMLSKTDSDSKADFHDVYDLDKVLHDDYSFSAGQADWVQRGERG